MKLSIAITVCDEDKELKLLLENLSKLKNINYEICILIDKLKTNQEVFELSKNHKYIISSFEGNFSIHKNKLKQICSGEWILWLDADELLNDALIENLSNIINSLNANNISIGKIARANKVEGISWTQLNEWGWNKWPNTEYINFPDYQSRLQINKDDIEWVGKVHERLLGKNVYETNIPYDECFLIHNKTINKQIKQNNLYSNL